MTLAGNDFTTDNPLTNERGDRATTGAFVPFGTPTSEGQVVPGRIPCGGSVLRIPPNGGSPELVAWRFRNPFGLAFSPHERLFVADNGYDDRGSRPVWGTADFLWEVTEDLWHGWPDFAGGVPLNGGPFKPPGEDAPSFLLLDHPNDAPRPVARLGVHSSSSGLDFSRSVTFGHGGDAFIAQFGDMAPDVGKVLAPVGYQVVRVDVATGTVFGFAANRGRRVGPASKLGVGGFERPIAVRFSPDGESLYVVDFGVMTMSESGPCRVHKRACCGESGGTPVKPSRWKTILKVRRAFRGLRTAAVILPLLVLVACGSARRGPPVQPPMEIAGAEDARGRAVFMHYCNGCHPRGEAGLGPGLNDKPLPGFLIKFQVRNGLGAMPAFSDYIISSEDLDDLVRYLIALRHHN